MLSIELIEYICSQNDDSGLIDILQKLLVRSGNFFNIAVAEAIDNALIARMERRAQPLTDWVSSFSRSHQLLPRFLYAQLAKRQGKDTEAVEMLQSVAESLPKVEPYLSWYIAKSLMRLKRFPNAAEHMKLALSMNPPYSFLIKSEKLLQKIVESGDWQPRRTIRVALIGSSTTTFLATALKASCFKVGIKVDLFEGEYGNYRQEILNPGSPLYTFKPQAVVLIPSHRDLALPPISKADIAMEVSEDVRRLWAILQNQNPCHLIQVGFDLMPYGSWGCLEDTEPGGRARIISSINSMLSEGLPSGVSFLDINKVALQLGDKFHSDIAWYSTRQYPSMESLPVFADYLVAHLRAAFGYSAKVLIFDLDNTLWGGVIGEDGLSGIVLGPPSPEGECYLDLQRYAKELKERGVLLAVCSKNNPEDAVLPFKEHDSMILRLDDFVFFNANWQDKATNLIEIAKQLSLGLDSFVFIDDNPLERAWVRSKLPEMIVPECGSKPWEILASLRRGMFFEAIKLTAEDSERHQSYKSDLARQEFENVCTTEEHFLAGLEMIVESGPVNAATITRVTQLINKTNQFNLTTRRYTEEQIRSITESKNWMTRWFRLKDKFGDHGLIGVILVKKNEKNWYIDTWIMSCRVLGRKMEQYMAEVLLKEALKEDVQEAYGEFIPSGKNELVRNIYSNIGFTQDNEPNRFIFRLLDYEIPHCLFVSDSIQSKT